MGIRVVFLGRRNEGKSGAKFRVVASGNEGYVRQFRKHCGESAFDRVFE